MNSLSNVGIIILLLCIALSRIISERAIKFLSPEEKVILVDSFSNFRTYNLLPLVVIFIAFISANYLMPSLGVSLYIIFLFVTLVFLMVLQILIFRKLVALKMPAVYTKTYVFSKAIVIAGFACWIGITAYPLIGEILG